MIFDCLTTNECNKITISEVKKLKIFNFRDFESMEVTVEMNKKLI